MLSWLSTNLVNIVLIAAIAVIVVLLIRSMIRDRKAGKSACGGNCACCGAYGQIRPIPKLRFVKKRLPRRPTGQFCRMAGEG